MSTRWGSWAGALAIGAVVGVAGCSDDGGESAAEPGGDSAPSTATTAEPDESAQTGPDVDAPVPDGAVIDLGDGVEIPQGQAGEQLRWVLETLNTPNSPTLSDAEARFAPSFLEVVSVEELPGVFDQIRSQAPLLVTAISGESRTWSATVSGEQPLILDLSVGSDGLMDGLTLRPDPLADRPPAEDFGQIDAELSKVADEHHLLAARVMDGACVPVFETDADESAPIGSAFKVYVLGALVDAVDRGDLAWDDDLTITDAVKSLPSGTLQEEPDGTTVTAQEAATAMMSISDNTATDMLIGAIGVDQVEAVYADMGIQDPEGLTPLLTTKQLFQLGWGADGNARARWSSADTQQQRAILADLAPGVEGVDPATVTSPRWREGIDYFATANELCAAHIALQQRAGTPAGEPVRDILSANPGLPSAAEQFDYLGFKGGSAPGQLTLTWYGEVGDTDMVTVIQVAGDSPIDPNVVLGPASDTLHLLRQEIDSQ